MLFKITNISIGTIAWMIVLSTKLSFANLSTETLASSVFRDVTHQLEKFNSHYINKLERELSSTSSRMSAMESTLRSIADRALAWDNIQNHMTVWTEQTRTMEKKLDMLNRCHEKQAGWESKLSAVDALNHKLTALDRKINTMTRLEFKVEKVLERVEEMNSKLKHIQESTYSRPEQPLLTQLAKRGFVNFFATIDEKLDDISNQVNKQKTFQKYRAPKISGTRPSNTWQSEHSGVPLENKECFMSTEDSQMMKDVSAKVDRLMDRMVDSDYDYDMFVGNLKRQVPMDQSMDSDLQSDFDSSSTEHLFAKFWKSLFSPFKKMNRRFRTFEGQLNTIEKSCNGTPAASSNSNLANVEKSLISRLNSVDEFLRKEFDETRISLEDQSSQMEKLSQVVGNVGYINKVLQTEVTRQFETQREVLQTRFQHINTLLFQCCSKKEERSTLPPITAAPTFLPVLPTFPVDSFPTPESDRTVDCSDYLHDTNPESKVYILGEIRDYNEANRDFNTRYCDQSTDEGGWTVIQRRGLFDGVSENFTMSWDDYKNGFGDLNKEFWWGNDFLHRLSNQKKLALRFDLWDFDGNYAFAEYSSFKIGSEDENYVLSVSGYRGNASDSFSAHNGYSFSTYDRDNDKAPECCPCAPAYGGGWWFYSCFESNLNGEYYKDPHNNNYYRGLIWELWLGDYSLQASEMKVRPVTFSQSVFPTPFPGSYPGNPLVPELP